MLSPIVGYPLGAAVLGTVYCDMALNVLVQVLSIGFNGGFVLIVCSDRPLSPCPLSP